jgi:phospholipid transport system transporter-binding protein
MTLPMPSADPHRQSGSPGLMLPAVLTHEQVAEVLVLLEQAVAAARDSNTAVVVNAALLQRFDSSALAVLLQGRRLAQAAQRPWLLQSVSDRLLSLIQLYGLNDLLLVAPDNSGSAPLTPAR